jgi:hypothetical protein
MKKLLSLAMAAALLMSCSDDDGPSVNMDELTGQKWYYNSYKVAGQTIPYDDNETCGKDYLEFFANGVVNDVDIWDCEPYVDSAAYNVTGKTITIIMDGDMITGTIKELTSKKLIIEDTFDYDGDGTDEKVQVIYTYN